MVQKYGRWRHVEGQPFTIVENVEDPDIVGFMKFQKTGDNSYEKRFLNEVNILKGLDHPNVVKLLDYDLEAEKPWMVTEYCKGGDMRQADLSSWTTEEKWRCHQQICAGLAYLWEQGILKGDHNLKNVFLKENKTPVIGDFEHALPTTDDAKGMHQVLDTASHLFWGLMEGKDFNKRLSQELHIKREINKLNEQIEELKAQKEELYNTPPPHF